MQFSSFAEFIDMGGYGFYVWLAIGFSVLVLIGISYFSFTKERNLITELHRNKDRQARFKQSREHMEKGNESSS